MSGELTPVQVAGIVVALRAKGETVTELSAAAMVMRELSIKVKIASDEHLVDTCGTGGDGAHTFNISTASAIVASAAGARVAKHGGRSVSSTCGSADVLESLGVNVNLSPDEVAQSVEQLGVGFMFAPNHHTAMRFAAPVRRELGIRTLFNLLGPMTNPAGAQNQVIGVYRRDLVPKVAHVLHELGSQHVLVVHGEDGLDEISISGNTYVAELKDGIIKEYTLTPSEFGLDTAATDSLRVHNTDEAKAALLSVLDNNAGPAKDIVILNASAAIYVAGLAETLQEAAHKAEAVISSGAARTKLQELIEFSHHWQGDR